MGDNGAYSVGGAIKEVTIAFSKLFTTVTSDGDQSAASLNTLADALLSVAGAINSVANAYKKARDIGGSIMDFLTISPGEGPKFADSALGKALQYNRRAIGGPVSNTNSYLVGENGPEIFTPSIGGKITPNGGSGGTTIILNGIVDAESARRSIEQLIQRSARRTGAIDWVGATL